MRNNMLSGISFGMRTSSTTFCLPSLPSTLRCRWAAVFGGVFLGQLIDFGVLVAADDRLVRNVKVLQARNRIDPVKPVHAGRREDRYIDSRGANLARRTPTAGHECAQHDIVDALILHRGR